MIRSLQLIFTPYKTWERIVQANQSLVATVLLYLLPMMLLSSLTEGIALATWGDIRGEFNPQPTSVATEIILRYELTQLLLGAVLVFWAAKILQSIVQSFDVPVNYAQCFTATAYGVSPIFLAQLLDSVPTINTWVCWTLGAIGCARLLYHRIGIVLKPTPSKGLGLFLLGVVVLVLMSGVAHFLAVSVLEGKLKF